MLRVYALDDMDITQEFGTHELLRAREVDLGMGEWRIEVPYSPAVRALYDATWPGIEIVDTDTGWRFGGFQTARGTTVDGAGEPLYWFAGLDFQAWLNGWVVWPDADSANFWMRVIGDTLPLTTATHNLAYFQFGPGPADAARQMPHLVGVGSNDPAAGPVPVFWFEGQRLLDLWSGWFTGTDYTVRLRLIRSGAGAGQLEFTTPERAVTEKVYEAATGAIGRVDTEERAAAATRAIMMGGDVAGGEAGERYVSDQAVPAAGWGSRYWETFRDRAGLEQAELDDETVKWLADLGPTESVTLGDVEVSGWGRTIDLGWKAQVRTTAGAGLLPVTASTVESKGGRVTRTASFGAEQLSPSEELARQVAALSARLYRLERFGVRT